ncbi:MAG TPA: NAD-dependent epimerase/dehydratase family protein [Gaiellales bacterium]|jgi:2'-hydroxyisoflavone reductase
MRILVLGGTRFVGRHIVEAARAHGHVVSVFNRGRSPLPWSDVEQLTGDREGGELAALRGRDWDACIDVSGYLPAEVRASAELLAGRVARYVFVSTASVYDLAGAAAGIDEDGALQAVPASEDGVPPPVLYGARKVACEQAAERAFPGRTLILRPVIVAGPFDPTNRFPWWVARVARGGELLAPVGPAAPVQLIDARDLAGFAIALTGAAATGTFTVCGPPSTFGELIAACRNATGSDAAPTWVPERVLLEHDVEPFTELPLWLDDDPEHRVFYTFSNARARAAGLAPRPLEETARATWEWLQAVRDGAAPAPLAAAFVARGLSAEREASVLAAARST